MEHLVDVAAKVSTPLALAGIVVAVFCWIALRVLKGKPEVGIQRTLIWSGFALAMVATVLGFAGFVVPLVAPSRSLSVSIPRTDTEEHVRQLKHRISALRADYESLNRYPGLRGPVHEEAARLGEEMLLIDDGVLNQVHQILQQEYGCYAFVMAASTDTERTSRIALADRGVIACELALKKVQEAEFRYGDAAEYRYALDFTRSDQGIDRTRYLLAMALAIKGKAEGRQELKQAVLDALKGISPQFVERVPPQKTQDLSWAFEKKR